MGGYVDLARRAHGARRVRLAALAVLPIVFSVLGVPAAAVAATHVETVAPSRVTSEHVAGRPVPTAGAVTRSARNAGSPRLTGRWQGAFHPKGASAGVWALRAEPLTGTSAVVVSPSPSPSATGPPAPSCTLPSAPGSVSATAGSNQATVSWAAAPRAGRGPPGPSSHRPPSCQRSRP
jgi:hypothetical protein